MTVVSSETSRHQSFWQRVGAVAGLYLLVQGGTLWMMRTGWAKYAVLPLSDPPQYWDAGIYAQLAIAPQCTAFYPFWPWLIRVLGSPVTVDQALRWATVGSTMLFLGSLPLALLTFEKLIKEQRLAFLALVLYALGPNAIFHTIGYTESWFSVLSLGWLLTLAVIEERPKLGWVELVALYSLLLGLTIAMSLTRPIMVPALGAIAGILGLVIVIRVCYPQKLSGAIAHAPLLSAKMVGMVGLVGCGTIGGYSLYGCACRQTVGDFWAPFHAQVDWGRSVALRPGLLLLPRSLLIDLHGLYLPLLLLAAIAWLLWGIYRRRSYLTLVLPRSPWFYALLAHPLIFCGGLVALWHWRRSHTQFLRRSVDPNWTNYLGRFSVLFAIAFCGAHSLINLLANSGQLYSTSRHVFGTPFAFVGIGALLAALDLPILNRVAWGVAAIGVGLLAQQWVAFASDGWLG